MDEATATATTVHPLQVVEGLVPDPHDVPIDLVVTPEETVETETPFSRPSGVDWDVLDADRIAEIPVLERLR